MSETVDPEAAIISSKRELYVQINPKTGWASISGKLFRDHFKNSQNEINLDVKHMYHFFEIHFKPVGINFFSQILTPDYMAAMSEYNNNKYDRSKIIKTLSYYISRDPIHAARQNIEYSQKQEVESDNKIAIDAILVKDLAPFVDLNYQYSSWFDISERVARYNNIQNLRTIYETKGEDAAMSAVIDRLASIFKVGITLLKDLSTEEKSNLLSVVKTSENTYLQDNSITPKNEELRKNYFQRIENIINESNKKRFVKK